MEFIFKATDQAGKMREGKIEASSQEAAVGILQKQGLLPVSLAHKNKSSDIMKELNRILEGVGKKEMVVFFRQLAILIDARVPIVSALESIHEQTENKFFRGVIKEIIDDIEDGMTLSDSLGKHPRIFTPLMVNMLKAGEVSGNLQRSISFMADNIEKNYQLTSKIRGALFYPAFVTSAALIIGFITITVILPKLTTVIKDMNVETPWYTKVLMWIGDFMQVYWWAVAAVIIGGIVAFVYYIKTEAGHKEWDQIKIKVPIMGNLLKCMYMARFADNFSVLLSGGIPILKALTLVSEVVNNSVYQGIILRCADEVKTGGSTSTVLARYSEIPPLVTRMVKIGEESGKLSEVLQKTALFYDEETDRITRNMTALIEPVLICILGVGVAIMVFAILLPIYDIASQIQ